MNTDKVADIKKLLFFLKFIVDIKIMLYKWVCLIETYTENSQMKSYAMWNFKLIWTGELRFVKAG